MGETENNERPPDDDPECIARPDCPCRGHRILRRLFQLCGEHKAIEASGKTVSVHVHGDVELQGVEATAFLQAFAFVKEMTGAPDESIPGMIMLRGVEKVFEDMTEVLEQAAAAPEEVAVLAVPIRAADAKRTLN